MKTIDWKITGSAPDFSSANQLSAMGSNNILKGLESLSNTAKAYGDKVTSDNTQELMSMLNKAKTPEELDGTIKGLMDFANSNYGSNYDKTALNTAIESRPQVLQQRVVNNNIYDTSVKSKADEKYILTGLQAVNNGDNAAYNQAASSMQTPSGFTTIYKAALDAEAVKQAKVDKDNELAYKFASLEDQRLAAEAEAAAKLRAEAAKNTSSGSSGGSSKTIVQSEGNGANGDIIFNLDSNGRFRPSTVNAASGVPVSGREATINYMLEKTRKLEGGRGKAHYTLAEQKAGIGSSAAGDLGLTKGTAENIINVNLPALTKEFGLNAKQLMDIVQNQSINPDVYTRIGEYGMNMAVNKLEENGIPVNPATLRGAWWLGDGGINTLMKNPNLSMDKISGVNWAKTQKQPKWEGMTGVQFAKILEQQTGYSLDGTPVGSTSINSGTNQGVPKKDIIPLQAKYAQAVSNYSRNSDQLKTPEAKLTEQAEIDKIWNGELSASNKSVFNEYATGGKLEGLTLSERKSLFTTLASQSKNSGMYDTDDESRAVIDAFIKDRNKIKAESSEQQFKAMLAQGRIEVKELMQRYKMDEKALTDAAVAELIFPAEYLQDYANKKLTRNKQKLMETQAQIKMNQNIANNKPQVVKLTTQGDGGLILGQAAKDPTQQSKLPSGVISRTQIAEEAIKQSAVNNTSSNPFNMVDTPQPKVVTPVNPRQVLNAQNATTQQKADVATTLTREAKVVRAKQEQEAKALRAKELAEQEERTNESLRLQQQREAAAKVKADKANADSAAKSKAVEEAKQLALAKQRAEAVKAAKAKADADLAKAKAKLQAARPIPKPTTNPPKFNSPQPSNNFLANPNNKFSVS